MCIRKDLQVDNAKIYLNEGEQQQEKLCFQEMKDHDNTRYNIGLGLTDVNLKANTYYSLRFVYGTHDVVYYFLYRKQRRY